LVLLQTIHLQQMWSSQSSKTFFTWGVSLNVRKEVVVWRGQIRWVGQVFRNFQVKICQFLVRNGFFVRSSNVLKKQDSFCKLVSMFGDQLLLQFVDKCNIVLCCDRWTLFQVAYKQNSMFVPEERRQHLAWWLLCLERLWMGGATASPFFGLFFGLWWIQVS
jgi:hypothetical protein